MSSNPAGNGGVPKSLFDANTILYATTDNTPAALTVGEQTVVGRATGGAIAALAIDSDLSSTSANDDTVPSAKAVKTITDGKSSYHGIEAAGALSFNDSTHVLSIASGTNTYWIAGVKYTTSSAITCDIDSFATLTANTLYFFYFDDATGTLKCSTSVYNLRTQVPVATVFWNGSAGLICSELHTYKRNLEWQIWAHESIGTRYGSGLALTTPTTGSPASLQIESGTIYDEDLVTNIAQQTTMRAVYKASASIFTWGNYAFPYPGTSGSPQYLNTGTYALTAVGASNFACYWVYATNDTGRPIHVYPTHASASYNTIALARSETPPVLSGFNLNPEYKLIYRFIFKGDGAFQEVNDYRQSSPLPSGGASAVTATSVSFAPTGNVAATNVQAAIEELDTEKVPYTGASGAVNIGSNLFTTATGVKTPLIYPASDSTTAFGIAKADGTTKVVTVDTTNARVGIGTTAPATTLHVAGDLRVNGATTTALRVAASSAVSGVDFQLGDASMRMGCFDSNNTFYGAAFQLFATSNGSFPGQLYFDCGNNANSRIYFRTGSGGTINTRLQINQNGTLQIAAYGAGTLTTDANGNITASSDERLKESIVPFGAGLAEVLGINPIQFKWAKESGLDTENTYTGWSAQNLMKRIPEAVATSESGFYGINDRPVIAALVNACKTLLKEINNLREALHLDPVDYSVADIQDTEKVIKYVPPPKDIGPPDSIR